MHLDLLDDLNTEQRTAALCRDHCLVVAIPGSGKTKTLAAKAAFVLSDGRSRVAAVTFTRESAIELRARIIKLIGKAALPRLIVGTYHSVDLLMAFPERVKFGGMGFDVLKGRHSPFRSPWAITNEGHRRSYIARAILESGMMIEMDEASRIIEAGKSEKAFLDTPEKQTLLSTYTSIMARHKEIDFQDIILKTNLALKDGSLAPLAVDMLLLDEYQDTDLAQYEWVAHHGRSGVKITAVGDDDQSIYAFRKAMGYKGMELFASQFRAEHIVLGTNYRSHEEILASANNVVKHNEARIPKEPRAQKGYGGAVEWEGFYSRELEADACAITAGEALNRGESFAVLTRNNARLDEVESRLVVRQIPFRRSEGESILDHRESALFCSVIESLYKSSPKMADEVMAWAGASDEDASKIHRLSGGKVQRVKPKLLIEAGITEEARSSWNRFAKLHEEWGTILRAGFDDASLLVRRGIFLFLSEHTKDARALSRLDLIQRMFECGKDGTLLKRLEQLQDAQKQRKEHEPGRLEVKLMTAHGSKGLEFDNVWIIGAEQEVFPSGKSPLDEERRLFYVAMTRARKRLTISKAGARPPSQFISESLIQRAALGKFTTDD